MENPPPRKFASTPAPSNTFSQPNQEQSEPQPGTSSSFFQQSPALSQISHEASGPSAVNRRLFGTPSASNRISSTPFTANQRPASPTTPLEAMQEIGLVNSRKRRLEDIFGDIRDIEEEQFRYESEAMAKKMRSEEEIDIDMIKQILEKRKQIVSLMNPMKASNLDKLEALHKFKKQNLSLSLPQFPFTTLVRDDKERIYVRMHSKEYEDKQIKDVHFTKSYGNLLGEAKDDVWQQAQKIVSYIFFNYCLET